MKKITISPLLVFCLFVFGTLSVYGQGTPLNQVDPEDQEEKKYTYSEGEWCGFVEHEEKTLKKLGIKYEQVEKEIQHLIAKKRLGDNINGWSAKEEEILTIPLVFHIIYPQKYENQPGVGGNMRDSRVHEQVEALNAHFGHTNSNKDLLLPLFRSFAVDTKIRFALAKKDPNGLPTTGILRGYVPPQHVLPLDATPNDENIGNFYSYIRSTESPPWDMHKYMNIYVFPKQNMGNLGGRATFPLANLPGMGVSHIHGYDEGGLDFRFSSTYDYEADIIMREDLITNKKDPLQGQRVSEGGVTVHEIGHQLGLRHIWGDGPCWAEDYCSDTPLQSKHYGFTKPSDYLKGGLSTCGSADMAQNYMDYLSEGYLALFTPCQKERMRVVLNASFGRKELVNPGVLQTPVASSGADLGIIRVDEPLNVCEGTDTYDVDVKVANYGAPMITSYKLEAYIEGTKVGERTLNGQNMATWQIHTTRITSITRHATTNQGVDIEVRVAEVNGAADAFTNNNSVTENIYFPATLTPTLTSSVRETFNGSTEKTDHWALSPQANTVTHQEVRIGETNNKALVYAFNDYPTKGGEKGIGYASWTYSPVIKTPTQSGHMLALRFPYSYTPKKGHFTDGFAIYLSDNPCDPRPRTRYITHFNGADMASSWYGHESKPDSTDWHTLLISLQSSANNKPFQLGIRAINGGGNPLYLDDVEIGFFPDSPLRIDKFTVPNTYCDETPIVAPWASIVTINPESTRHACETLLGCVWAKWPSHADGPQGMYAPWNLDANFGAGYCVDRYVYNKWFRRVPSPTKPEEFGSYLYSSFMHAGGAGSDANPYTVFTDTLFFSVAFLDNRNIQIPSGDLSYDFSTEDPLWIVQSAYTSNDKDHGLRWGRDATNGYLKGSFYGSSEKGSYVLLSPIVNLANGGSQFVEFDVSYARRTGDAGLGERLRVVVLQNGCDIYTGEVAYDKYGDQGANKLTTANAVSGAWTPSASSDWRRERVDISQYASQGAIQIAFVASNLQGNNLYIDNITFSTAPPVLSALGIEPSAPTVADGTAANVDVATLSATYTNLGSNPTFRYNIVGWTNAHAFKIVGNKLKTNQVISRSDNTSYTLRILVSHRANNGILLTQEKEVVITVTPSSSNPRIRLSSHSVVEGASAGTEVARLITEGIAFPSDHLGSVQYAISGGNEGGYFGVRNDVLYVAKTIPLRSQIPNHSVCLQANYGASAANDWVSISVETGLVLGGAARHTKLDVYPNPTGGTIHVRLPNDIGNQVTLTLLDANGRSVQSHKVSPSAEHNLPLPENSAGAVYFLRIESETFSTTRRVIVE